jgi:prevent-host-death family protein
MAAAQAEFPDLIRAAEKGLSTTITRDGRPVAVLVPFDVFERGGRQQPLLPWFGSGRGLWGGADRRALRRLRGEWDR